MSPSLYISASTFIWSLESAVADKSSTIQDNRFSALSPKEPAPDAPELYPRPPKSDFTFRYQQPKSTTVHAEPPSAFPGPPPIHEKNTEKNTEKIQDALATSKGASYLPKREKANILLPPSEKNLSQMHRDHEEKLLAPPSSAFTCVKKCSVPPALPLQPTTSKPSTQNRPALPIMGSNSTTAGPSILGLQISSTPCPSPSSPRMSTDSSSTSIQAQRQLDSQTLHPSFPTATPIASTPTGIPERSTTPYPAQNRQPAATQITVTPLNPQQQIRTAYPSGPPLLLDMKIPSWEIFSVATEITAVNQAAAKKVVISPKGPSSRFGSPATNFGERKPKINRKGSEKKREDKGYFDDSEDDGRGEKEESEDEGEWEWVGKVSA